MTRPGSAFRYEILASGERRWAGNALLFDSEEEALRAAQRKHAAWLMSAAYRVVPENHPKGQVYVPGSEYQE